MGHVLSHEHFADFDQYREHLRCWDTEAIQLSPGTLSIGCDCLDAGDLILMRLSFQPSVLFKSARDPGWYTFILDSSPKRWCGIDVPAQSFRTIAPPIMPITANGMNSRQCDFTSLRYAATVARLDGVIATALVALASSAVRPQATIDAKDRKVPPPATELTTPARKPPAASSRKSTNVTMVPDDPRRNWRLRRDRKTQHSEEAMRSLYRKTAPHQKPHSRNAVMRAFRLSIPAVPQARISNCAAPARCARSAHAARQ